MVPTSNIKIKNILCIQYNIIIIMCVCLYKIIIKYNFQGIGCISIASPLNKESLNGLQESIIILIYQSVHRVPMSLVYTTV